MRIVLLGPPGSGKGTQGERLSGVHNVPHISAGDMIRQQISKQTSFGRKVAAGIAQGKFAPDEDVIGWIEDRLSRQDAAAGYVLDGFPRTVVQALAFDKSNQTAKLDAVLELCLTEQMIVERLQGRWLCPLCERVYHDHSTPPHRTGYCDRDSSVLIRRADDDREIVEDRIRLYEAVTMPLRDYYQSQGLLLSVEAHGSPADVHSRIAALLNEQQAGCKNAWLEV